MVTRPGHLVKKCKGDAWECAQQADSIALRMPAGPRQGLGVAVVDSIVRDQTDRPWVRVRWFGKKGEPQSTVQCQPYEEKTDVEFTYILPVECLQRRAHLVSHGVYLLFNLFFIK